MTKQLLLLLAQYAVHFLELLPMLLLLLLGLLLFYLLLLDSLRVLPPLLLLLLHAADLYANAGQLDLQEEKLI